jgi:alkylhydroperoxidase family enzyme
MATLGLIEYADAGPEVRTIYDDIMATRKVDRVNNFWKAIAHDPVTLKRTWESIKRVMAPGALDALTKELIYVAVSVTNNCGYRIATHTCGKIVRFVCHAYNCIRSRWTISSNNRYRDR